jgi:hypothetical protein
MVPESFQIMTIFLECSSEEDLKLMFQHKKKDFPQDDIFKFSPEISV